MQALILGQHMHQRSLHLLHRNCDRPFAESLTQLSDPGFYRFHFVFQFATFPLRRAGDLQTPSMLLIRPIDSHEPGKLGLVHLLTDFTFWHSLYSSSSPINMEQRRACFREFLIVWSCCFSFRRSSECSLWKPSVSRCSKVWHKTSRVGQPNS